MNTSIRTSLVVTLTALALAGPAGAQEPRAAVDSATTTTIRRLLELTRATSVALRSMEAVLPAQRAANPQIPAAFWDAFLARVRRDMSELVDSLIPVYAAHFTRAQVEQLVRFYETPLGQHMVKVQPEIMETSGQVGRRWGMKVGQAVSDSLDRAGAKRPE